MSASSKKQKYRLYIHGYSFRHVYGSHQAKDITAWMVKLFKGEQPGFPHKGPYDWTVEKLNGYDYWEPISKHERELLLQAIHQQLAE